MTQTFLGRSRVGQKYVLPAEYDIYIDVSPFEYYPDSSSEQTAENQGFIEFKVYHTMIDPTPEDANLREWARVHRHTILESVWGDSTLEGTDFTADDIGDPTQEELEEEVQENEQDEIDLNEQSDEADQSGEPENNE